MSFEVKICGITTPEAIEAAADAGADAVGFVFAESVRQIGIERARELSRLCPPTLSRVAVFKHPTFDEVALVLESVDIDWVQSDAQDYDIIVDALEGTPFRPVYRTAAQEANRDNKVHPALHDIIAAGTRRGLNTGPILVEGPRSGTGIPPDWQQIVTLPQSLRIILAGGLSPLNIAEAVRRVRPAGVDTSSGVESQRGIKDATKIRAFVSAARAAHKALANGDHP